MYDFTDNDALAKLLAQFYENGKIVSSVCYGLSGLLNDDDYLVNGKKVIGFSWVGRKLAKRHEVVPFNLEEELKRRGANYSKSLIPFGSRVVVDGRLVTGKNPKSVKSFGKAVVKLLNEMK